LRAIIAPIPRHNCAVPLDVVIPDLLGAPFAARMPALERWLARGQSSTLPQGRLADVVGHAFGLPSPPPVAAVTLAGEGHPDVRPWLRADPVHFELMQDGVALRHSAVLDVTRDEATMLVAELQGLFASDGLEFRAPAPNRWYVRVPEAEVPATTPLDDALGRNVFGLLPHGRGRINWPSAITEVQMLFSGHAVNARRETDGRLAINSVWFWGEGRLPGEVSSPYALVHANEPFTRGLAILSRTRVVAVPSGYGGIDGVREDQSVLLVLDALSEAVRRGDAERFAGVAAALDDTWFVPLAQALDRFDVINVILPRGRDTLVTRITPGARWRLLRRAQPLARHA
jgi:hypothetical protein